VTSCAIHLSKMSNDAMDYSHAEHPQTKSEPPETPDVLMIGTNQAKQSGITAEASRKIDGNGKAIKKRMDIKSENLSSSRSKQSTASIPNSFGSCRDRF